MDRAMDHRHRQPTRLPQGECFAGKVHRGETEDGGPSRWVHLGLRKEIIQAVDRAVRRRQPTYPAKAVATRREPRLSGP